MATQLTSEKYCSLPPTAISTHTSLAEVSSVYINNVHFMQSTTFSSINSVAFAVAAALLAVVSSVCNACSFASAEASSRACLRVCLCLCEREHERGALRLVQCATQLATPQMR